MISASLVFGVLLAIAVGLTIFFYSKGYGALSPRSRLFRTAGMALLCLLLALALIFVGRDFVGRVGALQKLMLLISLYGLGVSLVCIALLDALESFVAMRKAERQVIQQVIENVAEEAQKQRNAQ
jgi:membrane protease YdiL (CAAX protease family)